MTTFTLQDLTPAQQEALTKHEALHALNMNRINNLPTTPEEDEMFKTMAEMSRETKDAMVEILHTRHVTEPQPTQMGEVLPNPDLATIINTICTQLQLLATVIKQQPSTTPPEGDQPTLQETIALTLQQADWFEKMVKEAVEERVESEVEDYFHHRFDPTDHFDFNDMINSEVSDQIDDIVRDQLDDVVESKLKDAHISINF